MSKQPTLLAQFRSFCYRNKISNFEVAVEYFSVFGGMGWTVDTSKSIEELIEEKVLANYRYIHGDITLITQSNPVYHSLLSALALGDRREHSAFKRANLDREKGEEAIDFLREKGLLILNNSIEKPVNEKDNNSDKLLFTQPFMRFFFFFISPNYKSIKEGDYAEVKEKWNHFKHGFSDLVYTQLIMEVLKKSMKDDANGGYISSIGSYWDSNVEIDILAKRKSGKMIAGLCKFTKSKANKSDLTKLREACAKAELDIDTFVIFSKSKFSSELKKEKGENLKLLSPRNMTTLIADLSQDDLLVHTNKKY